jgi:hypothetical protein
MPMDRPIARVSRGLSAYRAFSPRRADLGRGAESGQSRRSVVTFPPGEADAGSGDLADHSNRRSSLYVRADPQEEQIRFIRLIRCSIFRVHRG